MLVLSRSEVERLLDLDRLRQTIANAMADLSAGRVSMPSRIAAMVPERDALLAAMPAYLPSSGALATKLVSLFPRNTDRPTHQAVIVVFDARLQRFDPECARRRLVERDEHRSRSTTSLASLSARIS